MKSARKEKILEIRELTLWRLLPDRDGGDEEGSARFEEEEELLVSTISDPISLRLPRAKGGKKKREKGGIERGEEKVERQIAKGQ